MTNQAPKGTDCTSAAPAVITLATERSSMSNAESEGEDDATDAIIDGLLDARNAALADLAKMDEQWGEAIRERDAALARAEEAERERDEQIKARKFTEREADIREQRFKTRAEAAEAALSERDGRIEELMTAIREYIEQIDGYDGVASDGGLRAALSKETGE